MNPSLKTARIADLILNSKSTVVFTGAGISTESGIPDFRSKDGLWDGKDPMEISHVKRVYEKPEELFGFYSDRYQEFQAARPNQSHYILASWQEQGLIGKIVTQNIDGYHQRAGSTNVAELHGNMNLKCAHCGGTYDSTRYLEAYGRCIHPDVVEQTEVCDGIIRPNVTLFGEDLPVVPFHQAVQAHANAELCIIIGSSCEVYPANSLPQHTISNGGIVVIINKGGTALDRFATYKVDEWGAAVTLKEIDNFILQMKSV